MKAKTLVGEFGVSAGDRDYLFRPSLLAMDSLGSPSEIVEKFATLYSAPPENPYFPMQAYRSWERDIVSVSYDVLVACCEEDVIELVGHMGTRWGTFKSGLIPSSDMVHLARMLMVNGLIGDVPPAKSGPSKGEYSAEFDARKYVSQAVIHLGLTPDAAWNLTMTEFILYMREKIGEPEQKTPTLEEYDADMKRLDEINAIRDAGK